MQVSADWAWTALTEVKSTGRWWGWWGPCWRAIHQRSWDFEGQQHVAAGFELVILKCKTKKNNLKQKGKQNVFQAGKPCCLWHELSWSVSVVSCGLPLAAMSSGLSLLSYSKMYCSCVACLKVDFFFFLWQKGIYFRQAMEEGMSTSFRVSADTCPVEGNWVMFLRYKCWGVIHIVYYIHT